MFLSNVDDSIKQPEEKISYQKMKNNFNEESNSSYINSFYNEPSFFKKIKREENLKDLNISNSSKKKNDILLNEPLIKDKDKDKNILYKNETEEKEKDKEKDKEKKDKEKKEKDKLEEKKLINEYSKIIEKMLKEEQILFLDDNYHVQSNQICEIIPEDSSSYIISRRVNFLKEIYQSLFH